MFKYYNWFSNHQTNIHLYHSYSLSYIILFVSFLFILCLKEWCIIFQETQKNEEQEEPEHDKEVLGNQFYGSTTKLNRTNQPYEILKESV